MRLPHTLMLVRGVQLAQAQNSQRPQLRDGWLVTQDAAGNYWYLLHGELAGNAFDMQQTHQLLSSLNTPEARLKVRYPQAQLLARGTIFYSDYASAGEAGCFNPGCGEQSST